MKKRDIEIIAGNFKKLNNLINTLSNENKAFRYELKRIDTLAEKIHWRIKRDYNKFYQLGGWTAHKMFHHWEEIENERKNHE